MNKATDERAPTMSPWGPVQHANRLAEGIWSVSTSGHGGIWLSNERVAELHELMGYNYPTFCRDYQWYEEDCDWTIPVVAFRIEDSYEDACKQLRTMSNRWLDRKIFKQAHDALVAAGCILDHEKVKQSLDQWMEGYEAQVEAGQTRITRAEAERRFHQQHKDD